MKLLVIGEAPNRVEPVPLRPELVLTGKAGRNLAGLAGLSMFRYLRATERRNLFETCPRVWPRSEATRRADATALAGRVTLLLGTRVSRAFGLPPLRAPTAYRGGLVAVVPHPSGLNRWYNDPANRAAAEAIVRAALDAAEEVPE